MLAASLSATLSFAPSVGIHAGRATQNVVMKGSGFGTGQRDSNGMSEALPFLKRPPGLGAPGTMAGDIGFDPLCAIWSRSADFILFFFATRRC